MPRIRQQNVLAAQWAPNGSSLGAQDLTVADNQIFGENVFSPAIQRQRLPKDVYKKLSQTLAKGELLDTSLADAVALAMKEWAMEKGATHYAHVFQPLTGFTAEKHDSFYAPTGEGTALASFSGKELIQSEPDASSFPSAAFEPHWKRGATPRGIRRHRYSSSKPEWRASLHPVGIRRLGRRGARRDPPAPLEGHPLAENHRTLDLFGDKGALRVFTTLGPEQEYFLIDRATLRDAAGPVMGGRTLFGAKPPSGQQLEDHYFGVEFRSACSHACGGRVRTLQAGRADHDAAQRSCAVPVRNGAGVREPTSRSTTTNW